MELFAEEIAHLKPVIDQLAEKIECPVMVFDNVQNPVPVITSTKFSCICSLHTSKQARKICLKRTADLLSPGKKKITTFQCDLGLSFIVRAIDIYDGNYLLIIAGGFYVQTDNAVFAEEASTFTGQLPEKFKYEGFKIFSCLERDFQEKIEIFLSNMAHIEHLINTVRLRKIHTATLEILDNLSQDSAGGNILKLYDNLSASLLLLPDINAAGVVSYDEIKSNFEIVSVSGDFPEDFPLQFSVEGISSWVFWSKKMAVISDVRKDPMIHLQFKDELAAFAKQMVFLPLIVDAKVVGAVFVASKYQRKIDSQVINALSKIAEIAALVIKNIFQEKDSQCNERFFLAACEIIKIFRWIAEDNLKLVVDMILGIFKNTVFNNTAVCILFNKDDANWKLCTGVGIAEEKLTQIKAAKDLKEIDQLLLESKSIPIKIGSKVIGKCWFAECLFSKDNNVRLLQFICDVLGFAVEVNCKNSEGFDKHSNVKALMRIIEFRDPDTLGHSQRVGDYAALIAKDLKLDKDLVERIRLAGYLHDIGKICIPEEILLKTDKLSEREMRIIKKHVEIGVEIIGSIIELQNLVPAVKCHHERLDGSGYPQGLKGNQIPLEAQILAVADTYDALTSNRSYRNSFKIAEALKILMQNSGNHFNYKVVEALLNVIGEGEALNIDPKISEKNVPNLSDNLSSVLEDLTKREKEILKQIMKGLNNKEIADKLYISEKTVKTHVTNILRKLDVSDRTKAAALAFKYYRQKS